MIDIEKITEKHKELLRKELDAAFIYTQAKTDYEQTIALVFHNNPPVGKNAEEREMEKQARIATTEGIKSAKEYMDEAERIYELAKIERKGFETLISLTKAQLYSQGTK